MSLEVTAIALKNIFKRLEIIEKKLEESSNKKVYKITANQLIEMNEDLESKGYPSTIKLSSNFRDFLKREKGDLSYDDYIMRLVQETIKFKKQNIELKKLEVSGDKR